MHTVYRHTCPDGKVYIGMTSRDPKVRWDSGWGYNGQPFMDAIIQHGWDNIEHEIIKQYENKEEAIAEEVRLIAEHNSMNPLYGYNRETGGNKNKTLSTITKQKVGATLKAKGIIPPSRKGSISEKRKAVLQYTQDGFLIGEYPSIHAASEATGVNLMGVSDAANGKLKTSGGYVWRFKKNDE